MLLAVVLSIGAINALVPIIIILILIAAAAGATRGFSLFNIFGVASILGGMGSVGGATRGTAARTGYPLRLYLDKPKGGQGQGAVFKRRLRQGGRTLVGGSGGAYPITEKRNMPNAPTRAQTVVEERSLREKERVLGRGPVAAGATAAGNPTIIGKGVKQKGWVRLSAENAAAKARKTAGESKILETTKNKVLYTGSHIPVLGPAGTYMYAKRHPPQRPDVKNARIYLERDMLVDQLGMAELVHTPPKGANSYGTRYEELRRRARSGPLGQRMKAQDQLIQEGRRLNKQIIETEKEVRRLNKRQKWLGSAGAKLSYGTGNRPGGLEEQKKLNESQLARANVELSSLNAQFTTLRVGGEEYSRRFEKVNEGIGKIEEADKEFKEGKISDAEHKRRFDEVYDELYGSPGRRVSGKVPLTQYNPDDYKTDFLAKMQGEKAKIKVETETAKAPERHAPTVVSERKSEASDNSERIRKERERLEKEEEEKKKAQNKGQQQNDQESQ